MTTNDYLPPADDVEAAAKAIIEQGPSDVHWQIAYLVTFLVPCAMRALHARGWRDASEASSLIEAMHAANRERAKCAAERDDAIVKHQDELTAHAECAGELYAMTGERDAARAEVEAIHRKRDNQLGATCARWRHEVDTITADRDALAERCRVAEAKFTAANQRAIQLERNAILTPNGLAFATVTMERDAAEARAAKLEAALREIANDGEMTFRHAQAIARAALSTADTDGSKT